MLAHPVDPYRLNPTDVSDAIRSIRIAAMLIERFGVIAQPRTYNDSERLSDVLAEARQLYPQIWSHLDDARNALVQRGITVADYDELRASDAAQAPEILDVEVKDSADQRVQLALAGGVAKTARLNLAGHAAAHQACHALRRALPQVDWDALDRAEAAEIEAAGALRPSWKALVVGAIGFGIVVVLGVIFVYMRLSSSGH